MEPPKKRGTTVSLPLRWLFLAILCMGTQPLYGQGERLRVVSYNVENLFDTQDDPGTDDEAFLKEGDFRWTEDKYYRKIKQTAGVLADQGGWGYPALIGLVEVENQAVVRDLISHKSLRRQHYRMAVSRGADPRGVDVALLWHPRHFRQVAAYEIPHYGDLLYYPLRRDPRTREERSGTGRSTLWVVLESKKTGTLLDVLVVHLPSRRGGVRATSVKRGEVCAKIHRVLDSIIEERETPRILVMGDFNDTPTNVALKDSLQTFAVPDAGGDYRPERLYNLAVPLQERGEGTHVFGDEQWLPDQIIVSGALLNEQPGLYVDPPEQRVFSPEYLRQGRRPRRSFRGSRYSGSGFSDHFPVYIDLIIN